MVVGIVIVVISHGLASKERKMKKLVLIIVMSMLLMACGQKKEIKSNAPYYEAKEEVVFQTEATNPQSIIVKQGSIFIGTIEGKQLVIWLGETRYVGDPKKAQGINTMPIDATVSNVSLEKGVILKGANMVDKDNRVLFTSESDLNAMHYLQVVDFQGGQYVQFNVAGRIVYIPIEFVYIEPAQ